MQRIERYKLLIFTTHTVLGIVMAGCSRSNMDYGPAFASAETRGEIVYERNCSACHDAENVELLKHPPKLEGCFIERRFRAARQPQTGK